MDIIDVDPDPANVIIENNVAGLNGHATLDPNATSYDLICEIPEDLRKALRVEAFNRDVTVSALIRDILTKELKISSRKDVNDVVTK